MGAFCSSSIYEMPGIFWPLDRVHSISFPARSGCAWPASAAFGSKPKSDGHRSFGPLSYAMSWADEGWSAVLDGWQRAASRRGKTDEIPVLQPPATEEEIEAL